MHDERAAVRRWLSGQRAAARLQRSLQAIEGRARPVPWLSRCPRSKPWGDGPLFCL